MSPEEMKRLAKSRLRGGSKASAGDRNVSTTVGKSPRSGPFVPTNSKRTPTGPLVPSKPRTPTGPLLPGRGSSKRVPTTKSMQNAASKAYK